MTFVLLFSSFTMIRAVQEGQREKRRGVAIWMGLTIIGGLGFLGCQAWEWTTLIGGEHMSVTTNPFGAHTEPGFYLDGDGKQTEETFHIGSSYLIHKTTFGGAHDEPLLGAGTSHGEDSATHTAGTSHETDAHGTDDGHVGHTYAAPGDYPDAFVDERGYIHRKYIVSEGEHAGMIKTESFGPKAFGALFFFITGFHGFHVLSGVVFLLIIMINVISGLYVARKNKNEMVEKIGLYWHFVDLVWVFVFLVFYLI
jgi:cytochrome c oxidase subunit 3